MKKLFKVFLLPYRKKKLLGQSLFLVWVIRISLWLFPFRWLNEWLSRFDKFVPDNRQANWIVINSVVRSVRACSRFVPYASCLTQALAAQTLLRLRGQDSMLKIGVDKDENGKLMAHAWIEVDGKIIIGKLPQHRRFTVLNSSSSVVI